MITIKKVLKAGLFFLVLVVFMLQPIPSFASPAYRIVESTPLIVQPDLSPNYGNECSTSWKRLTDNNGWYFYVTLNTNNSSHSTNSAVWKPTLPYPGRYSVEVYNPNYSQFRWPCPAPNNSYVGPGSSKPPTSQAKYTIYHSTGSKQVTVGQNPPSNQWLSLGTFTFNMGTSGYVKLVDLNSESEWTRAITFSAVRFTYLDSVVSGRVLNGSDPMSGVTISDGQGHTAVTDTNGDYLLTGLLPGTYTISPSLTGYSFSPSSTQVTVPPDVTGVDFYNAYAVSGQVIDEGGFGISQVMITASNGLTATTDVEGSYMLSVLEAGSYTLVPTRGSDVFTPTMAVVSIPSTSPQNFMIMGRYFITGTVTDNNTPVANVLISCDGIDQGRQTLTGANGVYVCNDLLPDSFFVHGGSSTYSPQPLNTNVSLWPIGYGWFWLNTNKPHLDFTTAITTGQLYGKITDSKTGESIPNAKISGIGIQPLYTDADGHYQTTRISPGIYKVTITADGYRKRQQVVQIDVNPLGQKADITIEKIPPGAYYLPFKGGTTWTLTQGNNMPTRNWSHYRGRNDDGKYRYSFDFFPPNAKWNKAGIYWKDSDKVVVAARDGKVVRIDNTGFPRNCGSGNVKYVKIAHYNGNKLVAYSYYFHLESVDSKLREGRYVDRGQVIGIAGNTGCVYSSQKGPEAGTHLHFEVRDPKGRPISVVFEDVMNSSGQPGGRPSCSYKDGKLIACNKKYKSGNYRSTQAVSMDFGDFNVINLDETDIEGGVDIYLTGQPVYELALYAYGNYSDTLEMRLATSEAALSDTSWMPFTTTLTWASSAVYVQYRDSLGMLSTVYSDSINAVGYEIPDLAFSTTSTICTAQDIELTNLTNPYCEQCNWEWNFGNGQSFNGIEPLFDYMGLDGFPGYEAPGVYTITLEMSNIDSTYTLFKPIQVIQSPQADFNLTRLDNTITVEALELNASQWLWNFGNGFIETGRVVQYTYTSENEIPPYIELMVTGQNQCSAYSYAEVPFYPRIYLPLVVK